MAPEKRDDTEEVRRAFINTLNRHGYGFQEAVAELVTEFGRRGRTTWRVEATEFPVAVQHTATSIDLVLKAGPTDTYLVGECKRVDAALGRWCFARTPVRGSQSRLNRVILEQLACSTEGGNLRSSPLVKPWRPEPFTIGVEVRTNAKGDGVGGSKDAIQQSVAQVLRGASGLANHYYSRDRPDLGPNPRSFRFVPAVFTTADLWVTDADLTATQLESGTVPEEHFRTVRSGWLWFNHNLSPNLRHIIPGDTPRGLAEVLVAESTRSVAIINPLGLAEFLDFEFGEYR
jgi:hypothetical protein